MAGALARESARKPFETVVLNGAINLTNQVELSDEIKRQNWHRHLQGQGDGAPWWADLLDEDADFEDTQELIDLIRDELADLEEEEEEEEEDLDEDEVVERERGSSNNAFERAELEETGRPSWL